MSSEQELVKHTTDPVEKANLKLALDAMKVKHRAVTCFVFFTLAWKQETTNCSYACVAC